MKKIYMYILPFVLLLGMFANIVPLKAEDIREESGDKRNIQMEDYKELGYAANFVSIVDTDDGGYLSCGDAGLSETNPKPNSYQFVSLFKMNDLGELSLWKQYKPSGLDFDSYTTARSNAIIKSGDGGYLIVGFFSEKKESNPYYTANWIIKIDKDGNEIWNKTYGGISSTINDIEMNTDGGFIVCGGRVIDNITGAWAMRIDKNGEVIWSKNFHDNIKSKSFNGIVKSKDNNFILSGSMQSTVEGDVNGPTLALILKIDEDGNTIWLNNYTAGGESNVLRDIIETDEGNIIACGSLREKRNSISGGLIIKVDADGKEEWLKKYEFHEFHSIAEIKENSYIVSSGQRNVVTELPSTRATLMEIDQNGESGWNWTNSTLSVGLDVMVKGKDIIASGYNGYIAKFKDLDNQLRFDVNGGEGEMNSISLLFGEEKNIPSNAFTKKDYTFEGWSIDPDAIEPEYRDEGVYKQTIADDVTLYAVWKAVPIVITGLPETIKNNDSFQLTSNLKGVWSCDENYFEMTIDENNQASFTVIKAGMGTIYYNAENKATKEIELSVEEIYYKLSLDPNGGDGEEMEPISIAYGEALALQTNTYVRNDYTFEGWAITQEEANQKNVTYKNGEIYKLEVRENQRLYAVWIPIQIEVTDMPTTVQVDESFEVTLNLAELGTLEYDEMYFKVTSNDSKVKLPIGNKVKFTALKVGLTTVNFISSNGTRIEKEIEILENYYNITFDANGGEGTMNEIERTFEEETALPKNTFMRDDYTFEGWATSKDNADNGIVSFLDEDIYKLENKEATVFYAIWKAVDVQLSEIPKEIFEGESFTVTSNLKGNWIFEATILEMVEDNETTKTFKALKAGIAKLTFRANNGSKVEMTIEVKAKEVIGEPVKPKETTQLTSNASTSPNTGDDSDLSIILYLLFASLFVVAYKLKKN